MVVVLMLLLSMSMLMLMGCHDRLLEGAGVRGARFYIGGRPGRRQRGVFKVGLRIWVGPTSPARQAGCARNL